MKVMPAIGATLLVLGTGLAADTAKDPAALALLRGVEAARVKHDNLRVDLVMEYADRIKSCTVPCLVEQAGKRRRFEQFVGTCSQVGVVTLIVNDNEVWSYRRKENRDLDINDMARTVGVRGDVAFDPRTLGLDELFPTSADTTVRQLLGIETCDRAEVVGREELKGIRTWHVKAQWGVITSDFWIEEPSFRVHKLVLQGSNIHTEINSEFDLDNKTLPFPNRVEAIRNEPGRWYRRKVTVKSFEVGKPIPAARFTMKSLDLPVNTMINDYRIKRITGYWDGEKLSTDPVRTQPITRSTPWWRQINGLALMALLVLAVVVPCVFLVRRRWKGAE